MKANHISDSDIQSYVLGEEHDISIKHHIDHCNNCRRKAEGYRLLICSIQRLPGAEFDFNLSALVISQIPKQKSVTSDRRLPWSLAVIGIVAIITSGFLFWNYIVNQLPALSNMSLYLSITSVLLVFTFQAIDLLRKHGKQVDTLNFS